MGAEIQLGLARPLSVVVSVLYAQATTAVGGCHLLDSGKRPGEDGLLSGLFTALGHRKVGDHFGTVLSDP